MRFLFIVFLALFYSDTLSAHGQIVPQIPGNAVACHTMPTKLKGGAIHILRVKALSSQPTDGTYADEGYGQGEFDTVRLVEAVKSQIHWKRGLVFRVHPFPGMLNEQQNFAPEHLVKGKQYYIVYVYYLDDEPHGDSDLIGLTRCSVHEDTLSVRKQLLSDLSR
jgi:hypothetical protein